MRVCTIKGAVLGILALCVFAGEAALGQSASPRIDGLTPIQLRQGVNRVERFTTDGRAGQIVLAWRGTGTAGSHDVFLVMVPTRVGGQDWGVVEIEGDRSRPPELLVFDAPHTGEDFVKAVRFARGRVNGAPATLMLTATRDLSPEGIPAPSAVTFEAFQLRGPDDMTGGDSFVRILSRRSRGHFCNAEVALAREFNMPARMQRDWPQTPDGC